MSTTPIKSAKVRNTVKTALGAAVAVPLMFGALPASAASGQIGDTTFDLSGYIKLDALYSFEGRGSTSGVMVNDAAKNIVKNGDGEFKTTADQTRLRLSTDTSTQYGNVHGYIEMDFWPGHNSLRKRLAYVQWQGWTIGRAWSTFSDFHTGTTLNFGGPAGQVNQRANLVRYTVDMGDAGSFDVSLEDGSQSTASSDATPAPKNTTTRHQLPQLAMRYSGGVGSFDYQVAGLVRQNKFKTNQGSDSKVGWGLEAGGAFSLDSGTTLQLVGVYGEGVDNGDYAWFVLDPTNQSDARTSYIGADGSVHNNKVWAITGSVSQKITDKLSTNLIYSWIEGELGPNKTKNKGRTLAVNLMYSPVKPLVFGIEYSRAYADYEGQGSADANVVQFSTIYNF